MAHNKMISTRENRIVRERFNLVFKVGHFPNRRAGFPVAHSDEHQRGKSGKPADLPDGLLKIYWETRFANAFVANVARDGRTGMTTTALRLEMIRGRCPRV